MERKFTVLYGSETGTAQDLSEHIWRESKKYGFKGQSYDYSYHHEKVLYVKIFCYHFRQSSSNGRL